MAASVEIWMPIMIGDYLAETQHLSAEQCGAYLNLKAHYWKSGFLPLDLEVTRRISRVEKDAWPHAWATLAHFFSRSEAGFKRAVWDSEKEKAEELRASKHEKAKRAAAKRWERDTADAKDTAPDHAPDPAPANASGSAQALPGLCPLPSPSPSPSKQSQKPSRAAREGDPRHGLFRGAVEAYAAFKRVKLPWNGSEARALVVLLRSAPELTLEEFQACLNHRARSPGTPHGERPRVWLPHILKYQQGPLNPFGKTEEANSATRNNRTKTERSEDAALEYLKGRAAELGLIPDAANAHAAGSDSEGSRHLLGAG